MHLVKRSIFAPCPKFVFIYIDRLVGNKRLSEEDTGYWYSNEEQK